MTTQKQMICIRCPLGCPLTVTLEDDKVVRVEGQGCKRGEDYAAVESVAPMRTVTSSVRVTGGDIRMAPVRTAADIPKAKMLDCMEALKGITLKAPVRIGDAVVKNIAGTGVDMIATRNIEIA